MEKKGALFLHTDSTVLSLDNLKLLNNFTTHLFVKAVQAQTTESLTTDGHLQTFRAKLHHPKCCILNQRTRVYFHNLWGKREGFKGPILYCTTTDTSMCIHTYIHTYNTYTHTYE